MREMKESGIDWIGKIPQNWNIIRAKNIFKNHKDIVGDKENEYERLALTLNGVLKRPKDDSKGLQSESLSTYQILNEKELVFKMIDLANVNTSRVGYSPYTGIVSPVYIIFNNDKYSKFGYYYFYSMWQREIFNNLGNDGVRSALNASDMMNLPFPDISSEEANKIARFLDKKIIEINNVIEKTKETIEDYYKLKQNIITKAVTKGINDDINLIDSGKDFIGKTPYNWSVRKIRYYTEFYNGDRTSRYPKPEELQDEGIAFLSSRELENNYIDITNTKYISEEKYNSLSGAKLEIGDIVFCLRGSVGKCSLNNVLDKGTVASSLMTIRPKKINNMFLLFYLLSDVIKTQTSIYMNGTCAANLSAESVGEYYISIPSIDEQEKIVAYLDKKIVEIDNLISSKQKIIEDLEQYKKSLIYEYVTGKKEVV